jgi:hypothetical protein
MIHAGLMGFVDKLGEQLLPVNDHNRNNINRSQVALVR